MASTETCLQITSPLVQPGEHRLNECYYEGSRFLASSLQAIRACAVMDIMLINVPGAAEPLRPARQRLRWRFP